jgi:hypothetical protein
MILFVHSSVSMILYQGTYRGIESHSAHSLSLHSFRFHNWVSTCSFSYVRPPCQGNKPLAGKTHVTTSLEQINTCAKLTTAIKQENSNPVWNRGMSDLYPYSLPRTRVDSIERFSAKPLKTFQIENKTLPFLFNINRPMARRPIYLLIFLTA